MDEEKQPEQECVYCAADQAYEQVMSSSQINPDKTVGNTCSKE